MLFLIILVFFLPSILALLKGKRNKGAIFFTNLFFGWTIVGWGLAMIWALTRDPKVS